MSKKTFMAVITISLILILTVAGAVVIELARADPIPWPTIPNQEKPTLTVETPQNNTAYNASSVYLNFTVTKPDSWNAVHIVVPYIGEIAYANVYLDGNLTNYGRFYAPGSSFSLKLNQTASGPHSLNVTVQSYTYYQGPIYGNSSIISNITSVSIVNGVSVPEKPIYLYPIVVSDIVYFTVLGEPSPSHQETGSFPTATVAAVSTVAVVAVGAGLVVYFKKRRTAPEHIIKRQ
ncbi:MAG: hypothetical protein ABSA75_10900 [Candidatus Bathyarchaeia archaeon]